MAWWGFLDGVSPSAPPKVTDEALRNAESAHVQWVTPTGTSTPTVDVG
jgi:hypothetical protein